jgi:hypothetical protein
METKIIEIADQTLAVTITAPNIHLKVTTPREFLDAALAQAKISLGSQIPGRPINLEMVFSS